MLRLHFYLSRVSSPEETNVLILFPNLSRTARLSHDRPSLNVLLAVAQALGWSTRALDVECAYLYGDIPDQVRGQVWIKPPLGMSVSLPHIPGREIGLDLQKTLYGLRFSGRIYIRNLNGKLIILRVYVDDLALFSPHPDAIQEVQGLLMSEFAMKDLGALHTCTSDYISIVLLSI